MEDTTVVVNGMWFAAAISALVAVILIAVIWQIGGAVRARASAAREEAYRALARKTAASQEQTGTELGSIAGDLTDIKTRLASIEKMMRDVE